MTDNGSTVSTVYICSCVGYFQSIRSRLAVASEALHCVATIWFTCTDCLPVNCKLYVAVRWQGCCSACFRVNTGVKKGTSLYHALCNLSVNKVMLVFNTIDIFCMLNKTWVCFVLYAGDWRCYTWICVIRKRETHVKIKRRLFY